MERTCRFSCGHYTQVRKRRPEFNVIQESATKSTRRAAIIHRDVLINLKEVFPRLGGDDYLEHRFASSWRRSSSGMPWPASSWAIPRSVAASV